MSFSSPPDSFFSHSSLSLSPPPHPPPLTIPDTFLSTHSSRLIVTTGKHREAFRRVSSERRAWQFEKWLVVTSMLRHQSGRETEEDREEAQTSTSNDNTPGPQCSPSETHPSTDKEAREDRERLRKLMSGICARCS